MIASELSETIASFGPLLLGLAAVGGVIMTKRDTKAINNAVNHRKPNEPTLVQMVDDTHQRLESIEKAHWKHLGWHSGKSFVTAEEVDELIRKAKFK